MTSVVLGVLVFVGAGCGSAVPPTATAPAPEVPPTATWVPITITTPERDAFVASPIVASGLGIAFENTIALRVVDMHGKTLARTFTTAYAPEYTAPGPWDATIAYTSPTTDTGYLEAYESSAKDGRELHLVRVPIRFSDAIVSMSAAVLPTVTLRTNYGSIEIELYADDAPKTVANFLTLARAGFYNGTQFHRVIPDFMIQGGDPLTRTQPDDFRMHGTGGPGEMFADEINARKIVRGTLAMANSGPDTNGSQFFIVTADATPWLDGKHTVFGRVVVGMEVVDTIEQVERDQRDHPVDKVIVEMMIVE
ncbi:MAG: peptidylprolyl isomerase [bacterium]|nr:peptidylprolyl isomerase [bacterium]